LALDTKIRERNRSLFGNERLLTRDDISSVNGGFLPFCIGSNPVRDLSLLAACGSRMNGVEDRASMEHCLRLNLSPRQDAAIVIEELAARLESVP
jgi:hypothetical protein